MAYISEGCDLLDIGCASGKQTFKAEELGATVTGIDCWTGTLYSRKSCRRRFFSLLPAGWETRHLIGWYNRAREGSSYSRGDVWRNSQDRDSV